MSKCLICTEDFSEEYTIPKVLPCGHSSCARCIFERSQTYKAFVCPECGITIRDFNILSRLPNNTALINCIRQMKAPKYHQSFPSSFFSPSNSAPLMQTQDTINFSPSFDNFFSHSPNRAHHPHPNPNDSFNFDGFRAFLDHATAPRERNLQRSFTDPRKSRSKTPPRKVNGIEYSQKGVFREKSPRNVETCDMKMCTYPKMVIKGSKVPFCSFHYNQLNKTGTFGPGPTMNPMMNLSNISPRSTSNFTQSPGGFPTYKSADNSMMSAPPLSQSMTQMHISNNSFDQTPSQSHSSHSMGYSRQKPQFGKPSALNDLMGYYSETPPSSQEEYANAYKGIAMTNSSVFSGFGGSQGQGQGQGHDQSQSGQSMTFGKSASGWQNSGSGWQTQEPKVPFPEIKEKKKPVQLENKCILPDCQNQRLVVQGFTFPVCGKKCFRRWEEMPKQGVDWNGFGF